jgi:hypothetical protein
MAEPFDSHEPIKNHQPTYTDVYDNNDFHQNNYNCANSARDLCTFLNNAAVEASSNFHPFSDMEFYLFAY